MITYVNYGKYAYVIYNRANPREPFWCSTSSWLIPGSIED